MCIHVCNQGPVSLSRSNTYYLWEITIPFDDLATTIPRKYLRFSKSSNSNSWARNFFKLANSTLSVPVMRTSSTQLASCHMLVEMARSCVCLKLCTFIQCCKNRITRPSNREYSLVGFMPRRLDGNRDQYSLVGPRRATRSKPVHVIDFYLLRFFTKSTSFFFDLSSNQVIDFFLLQFLTKSTLSLTDSCSISASASGLWFDFCFCLRFSGSISASASVIRILSRKCE